MVNTCDNCYYHRLLNTIDYCCRSAPVSVGSDPLQPPSWKVLDKINSPYWCGDGADSITKQSFSTGVTSQSGLPGTPSPDSINVFYPDPNIVHANNSWDLIDFTSVTDLSGIPDVTAAVQTAINACIGSPTGGIVQMPPGVFRINNLRINGNGVYLRGYSIQTSPSNNPPALRPKTGTFILHDNNASSAIVVPNLTASVRISDLAFIQPQTPEGAAWSPVTFPPCIQFNGPNSISAMLQRLLFWGVFQAISLGTAAGQGVGTVRIRDVDMATFCGPYVAGITIFGNGLTGGQVDDVLLEDVNFNPDQLLAGSPNQQAYILTNACAINVSADNWLTRITNSTVRSSNIGFGVSSTHGYGAGTGIAQQIRIDNCHANGCIYGIFDAATNAFFNVDNTSVVGLGSGVVSYGYYSGGNGSIVNLMGMNFADVKGSAVVLATFGGGTDLRIGPNTVIERYNLDLGGEPAI